MNYNAYLAGAAKGLSISVRVFNPATNMWWNGTTWSAAEGDAEMTALAEVSIDDPLTNTYAGLVIVPSGSFIAEYVNIANSEVIANEVYDLTSSRIGSENTVAGSAGKLTYLDLVNRVLKRISQLELTSLSGITGQAKIISELINEAQNELWTESTNWHSLFKMRTFNTVSYTASTISFQHSEYNNDSITDNTSGFGNFSSGQTIVVTGSGSNDGVYEIDTASSSDLILQPLDILTNEAAGSSITIYAITYPMATDWGRTFHLVDTTNSTILTEDNTRAFSEVDPSLNQIGNLSYFSIQGNFYRFYSIPTNGTKIVERYWKVPGELILDTDVSDLPLFCENFLIQWAHMKVLEYLNKFEIADRIRGEIYGNPTRKDEGILQKIKAANKRVIDTMLKFQPTSEYRGLQPPKFPANY
jgi:hypothetical protein